MMASNFFPPAPQEWQSFAKTVGVVTDHLSKQLEKTARVSDKEKEDEETIQVRAATQVLIELNRERFTHPVGYRFVDPRNQKCMAIFGDQNEIRVFFDDADAEGSVIENVFELVRHFERFAQSSHDLSFLKLKTLPTPEPKKKVTTTKKTKKDKEEEEEEVVVVATEEETKKATGGKRKTSTSTSTASTSKKRKKAAE